MHVRTLAVLETMWGGKRPLGVFRINPHNHSGRRLHTLLGHSEFLVTNACPQCVSGPNEHGKPDPEWLARNLQRLTYDLLLVCGNVARRTYEQCSYRPECRLIFMPHPAARMWSKEMMIQWQAVIREGKH